MDYDIPTSRYSSTVRFIAVAIVLVVLLLMGLFFGKRIIANINNTEKRPTTATNKTIESRKQAEKIADTNKKTQSANQRAAAKKAEAEQKAEADRQAEAKKKQEAQAVATTQTNVASTGPSTVVSTGPTENIIALAIGTSALGYAGFTFIRSKRNLGAMMARQGRGSVE